MSIRHCIAAAVVFAALSDLSLATAQNPAQTALKPTASGLKKHVATTHDSHPEEDGQRIFEQNCARCHNAPEGFSPRISGTIVRHMRVRASLSQHDEEELLRFFNP